MRMRMPMRIFPGTAEWWEPLLSPSILVADTVGVLAQAQPSTPTNAPHGLADDAV